VNQVTRLIQNNQLEFNSEGAVFLGLTSV